MSYGPSLPPTSFWSAATEEVETDPDEATIGEAETLMERAVMIGNAPGVESGTAGASAVGAGTAFAV